MKIKILTYLSSLICFLNACNQPGGQLQVPNLQAGKDAPVFATYAAAKERSSFLLDQGYEYHYYQNEEPVGFYSAQGGDLLLGFQYGDRWITNLQDLAKPPVINYTYPDMVKTTFHPVDQLKAEVVFLVESSNAAIIELTLHNEGDQAEKIKFVPYLHNQYRTFNQLRTTSNGAFFHHQKYPDAWTKSHDLPHIDSLKNLMLLNPSSDVHFFNSNGQESPRLPFSLAPDQESFFQVTGRAYTPEGERYLEDPPRVRIQVQSPTQPERIITETSPIWGRYQQSVNDGYFRIELGNLDLIKPDLEYTFKYYYEPENLSAQYDTTLNLPPEQTSLRRNLVPEENQLPVPPSNVRIKLHADGNRLSWDRSTKSDRYHVYRRQEEKSYFTRIATAVSGTSYLDNSASQDSLYRYVITSIDQSDREGIHSREVVNLPQANMNFFLNGATQPSIMDYASYIAFTNELEIEPGQSEKIRLVRVFDKQETSDQSLNKAANSLMQVDLRPYLQANLELFAPANKMVQFNDPEKDLLFQSANNLMRQVFYPPEAKSSYNYYVFSREPVWGWGHGGQVFHESITMLAYAYLDPESAMNSQRVYAERQYENGYINYRTGSYLDEIIEHDNQLTSSAPWYSWLNWEIYQITQDREFLQEMYTSSKRFYNFYISSRDSDQDGLCEWGGHAVLESVRDALVAVWDQVGWPSNFEGVDLNSMLVMEAKALENMALELGLNAEAEQWRQDHQQRTKLINQYCWDPENGFYYNVDKEDNDFTFKEANDLKRDEIIGFLPLWAGIANQAQAQRLVDHLTDTAKFWRKYGIPSLAADDPYYNDKGYWNGPVWIQWNYLIERGLIDYGYHKEANELVEKVAANMIGQLKENHNLWEFYSPDTEWGGYHKTYIWAGIINRMLLDVQNNEKTN